MDKFKVCARLSSHLRRQVVHLVRAHLRQDLDEAGAVQQVAVVQVHAALAVGGGVAVEVLQGKRIRILLGDRGVRWGNSLLLSDLNPARVEGGAPPHYTVDLVVEAEEELGEVAAVLRKQKKSFPK